MSLQIVNVSQNYGSRIVLAGVSANLMPGKINVLMGPSGCGKSTLLRMLGGVRPQNVKTPSSGQVLLDGKEIKDALPEAVTVFQKPANRPDLTVFENVKLPFTLKCWRDDRPQVDKLVTEVLGEVGLTGKADNYPHELSGGQNQRVALARALVIQPRILLLDEPFSALDHVLRVEMQKLLAVIVGARQCTCVMVTHDPAEAVALADQIIVLGGNVASVKFTHTLQRQIGQLNGEHITLERDIIAALK